MRAMSYGFMVWSVDTLKIRQVVGSKDDKLRRMIGGRFKRDLASLDDLFDHAIAAGAPNTYEALRRIVDGDELGRDHGAIYRYAYKLIVEHFGSALDNNAVYPWRGEFDGIDGALADLGVPFKLSRFFATDLPVDLPRPDDFPLSGWVDGAEVNAAHAAFQRASLAGVAPEWRGVVDCVRLWFHQAAAKRRGLVSFYH